LSLGGGSEIWRFTPADARVAVAAAVDARRARPLLKVPLGRVFATTTSFGLFVALVAAGLGIYQFVKGLTGLILSIVVFTLGNAGGLFSMPHNVRTVRFSVRQIRAMRTFNKAMSHSNVRTGDERRIAACNRVILEGSLQIASSAVLLLFNELAGPDALEDELLPERLPVWPAFLYWEAYRATAHDKAPQDRRLFLEQTFATAHPVWATVAAYELLSILDPVTEGQRVRQLTDWVITVGDRGVAIECAYYDGAVDKKHRG
jgi:hypothetical protein